MTTKYEIELNVERFARTRPSKFGGCMHGTIIRTGITSGLDMTVDEELHPVK